MMIRIQAGILLLALVALAGASGAPAGGVKSASVGIDFVVGTDGNCYPRSTATWSGYQVNRVRHIFYLTGHTGNDAQAFTTTGYPPGESHSSGSFRSTSPVPFYRGESWYVHALFRSNGGAILAEASSPDLVVPDSCPERA